MTKLTVLLLRWFTLLMGLIQLGLDRLLFAAYSAPYAFIRKSLVPPVYQLRRLFLFLRRGMRCQVFILTGRDPATGKRLRVGFLYEGKGLNYLVTLLFGGDTVLREDRGIARPWQIRQTAARLAREVDLVVLERNTLLRWLPEEGIWTAGPTWARMVYDFPKGMTWEQVEHGMRGQEKNLKKVRKAGFTTQNSTSDADFDYFYQRMHIPLIQNRHRGYGIVDTCENMRKYFHRGFLMFAVDSSGQRVAADLNVLSGDLFLGLSNGLLDGDTDLLENGALSALYYNSIKWCYENGIRRYDLGEVRPFANNGQYQYKRRWGFRPTQEMWNTREWVFWVPNGSAVARKWVEDHPFIPELGRRGGHEHAGSPAASPGLNAWPEPSGSQD